MFDPHMIPFFAIFVVIGLPIICGTIIVLMKMARSGKGKGGQLNEQETRIMQEIHQGLSRLEKRIEALETIIIDKK